MELKDRIKTVIENRQGDKAAITRRELLRVIDMPPGADRKVRQLISELRHEGCPILFSTGNPGGYYMPRNLKELHEGILKMRSYVIDECQIMAAWKTFGHRYLAGERQGQLI